MKNLIPGWVWIPAAFLILVGATEYLIDSGDSFAFIEYPVLQLVLLAGLLFFIALDLILAAINNVMFRSLSEEAQQRYLEEREARLAPYRLKNIYRKMMGTRPLSEERDIELDHNYDGIKELDNTLPPWWLYSFYVSIVFAVGYMVYYHVLDGDNQVMEYEREMAAAQVAIEEYKKNAPDLVSAENVVALTETADIEKGASLYQANCMACHAADGGGGIGPNLTDDHWILGGGIKNVFHTVSEGGRAGKGMIAWKSTLKPTEIQQVASYILTLNGSQPANPKEPEGDIWTAE